MWLSLQLSDRCLAKLNVIISETLRYARICTRGSSFILHTALLICKLLDKGHKWSRCFSTLKNVAIFLTNKIGLYGFSKPDFFLNDVKARARRMQKDPTKWGLHLRPFARYLKPPNVG